MMPYKIPALAGQPYRPSNGTEGLMFEEQFCERCKHERIKPNGEFAKQCRIHTNAFFFDEDDKAYPKEWTHDAEGCPTCTKFAERTLVQLKPRVQQKHPDQVVLPGIE